MNPEDKEMKERAFYRRVWIKGETDRAFRGLPELYPSPLALRKADKERQGTFLIEPLSPAKPAPIIRKNWWAW